MKLRASSSAFIHIHLIILYTIEYGAAGYTSYAGRVGKFKGKFKKKSSITRLEKCIEGTKKYHINRKLKDDYSDTEQSDINEINETRFAAPGQRV